MLEASPKPRSIYVHVPFCTRRCSYCDFAVDATSDAPVGEWLEAVAAELAGVARELGWDEPLELDTIYVGGGTPSLLGRGSLKVFRDRLRRYARWEPAAIEWTAEANPESFDERLAADWRATGITRVSLGVQTFHEGTLRWMGRLHGPDGPGRAMFAARAAGFDDVSVDLIFGLPDRLGRDWADDLERALALEPEHVSLYGLTAEPGAPLGRWVAHGREVLADEGRYADEYLLAHERLTAAGYEHYEVSNFCRPGRRSRHNLAYWSGAPYAALGPGAHAYFPPRRRWNLRSWGAYREAVLAGRSPLDGEEVVGGAAAELERIWLRLRTDRGFPLAEAAPRQAELAADWERRGLANLDGERVRLTAAGWLLLDALAVEFQRPAARGRVRSAGAGSPPI